MLDLNRPQWIEAVLLEEADGGHEPFSAEPKCGTKRTWRHALIRNVSGMLGFDISRERRPYGWPIQMTGHLSGSGHGHHWYAPSLAVTLN